MNSEDPETKQLFEENITSYYIYIIIYIIICIILSFRQGS